MKTPEDLATKIEQLVGDHIAELQRSTAAAVDRAFALPARTKPKATTRSTMTKRRDPEELAAVAERLHVAVAATPGETMAVLAEQLGVTVAELSLPMNKLRRQGRLRCVGARSNTRYFPAVDAAANASR